MNKHLRRSTFNLCGNATCLFHVTFFFWERVDSLALAFFLESLSHNPSLHLYLRWSQLLGQDLPWDPIKKTKDGSFPAMRCEDTDADSA